MKYKCILCNLMKVDKKGYACKQCSKGYLESKLHDYREKKDEY